MAIENGDPNIINEVLSEFLKKNQGHEQGILNLTTIYQIPDGPRCLRNYAKKRNNQAILKSMVQYQLETKAKLAQLKPKEKNDVSSSSFQNVNNLRVDSALAKMQILQACENEQEENSESLNQSLTNQYVLDEQFYSSTIKDFESF